MTAVPPPSAHPPLNEAEQRFLLDLAREAIHRALHGLAAPPVPQDASLRRPSGAFVTLRRAGELRGCVGRIEAPTPLAEVVARAAVAAALEDGRFEPVQASELAELTVEISVLGPVQPIEPAEVRVGTHGLIVRHAGRAGLLLPQVAVEHGWDAETFLDHTCRKAGLPTSQWRLPGVELLAFTAQVFGD